MTTCDVSYWAGELIGALTVILWVAVFIMIRRQSHRRGQQGGGEGGE